jgi:DNA-binding PadR family transcriptional regulator
MTKPLLTYTSASVARVLIKNPSREHYGVQIYRDAGVAPGTVYPMLEEWSRRGWLSYREETADEARKRGSKGPPRRYVRLTRRGLTALTEYIQRWDAQEAKSRAVR